MMTRFARFGKKKSLEATPWHELVAFHGSKGPEDGKNCIDKKTPTAENKKSIKHGMKRKSYSNEDDSVAPKTLTLSEIRLNKHMKLDKAVGIMKLKKKNLKSKRVKIVHLLHNSKKKKRCQTKEPDSNGNQELSMSRDVKPEELMKNENAVGNGTSDLVPKTIKPLQNPDQETANVKVRDSLKKDMQNKKQEMINTLPGDQIKKNIPDERKSLYSKKFNVKRRKGGLSAKMPISEVSDIRKEARRMRRAKMKACFHCRQAGHLVSECPMLEGMMSGVGNCYKCGSSEHTTAKCKIAKKGDSDFPFAKCFICGETGHLARTCPDNPKGLYPYGGGCKLCGSVEHFRRDCPELPQQSKSKGATAHHDRFKVGHYSADAQQEDDEEPRQRTPKQLGPRVVKF